VKNKYILKKFLSVGLLVIVVFSLMLGILLAVIPTRMSTKHTEKIVGLYARDTGYNIEEFESKYGKGEKTILTSEYKHNIPVFYYTANDCPTNNVMILVHWHESNHKAMYPLAEEFLQHGYDVILYDQRSHGENTAETVSFGLFESKDLQHVVQYVVDNYDYSKISILGQSMGAATVAYYSGTEHANEHVNCVIIDSAYSSMYEEVAWEISKSRDSFFGHTLSDYGSLYSKLINNFSFQDADIVKRVKNNNLPTMIVHSRKDMKCPFYMGEELYKAIPHENKRFEIYDESEHLFAYWDESERYINSVISFIDDYE